MRIHKFTIKKSVKNESGFTLLEILAVLVILGILSVVALPKYFNLQANARARAMAAGEAEAIGRVNGYFAEQVLGGTAPADIQYTNTTLDFANFGNDFAATVTSGATDDPIEITLSAVAGSAIDGATDVPISIPRPGL